MGEVLAGLETEESTPFPFPCYTRGINGALPGQRPLSLQDKVLYPESEAVLLTLDRQPS